MGVRSYTVSKLQIIPAEVAAFIPVFPRPAAEVSELYQLVVSSEIFQEALVEGEEANLAYIFPGDFFLTAIVTDENRHFSEDIIDRFPEVLEWHKYKFDGGLGRFFRIFHSFFVTLGNTETNFDVERIVFVRVENGQGELLPSDKLFTLGATRRPVLIVDVDLFDEKVLSVQNTSGEHKWGTMPMPSF
jgi:hypothetical protein